MNLNMQIRQLTNQEFDKRMELSMYAFQYELMDEEMAEARSRFKPEETCGVFIQNQLAAQLTLIPLQIYLQGRANCTARIDHSYYNDLFARLFLTLHSRRMMDFIRLLQSL